jgi:50S ribosomal subunit-associated GTPase HflX
VVAKVRERLSVSKKETKKFDVERFNPRRLRELEVRKPYQVKISNKITALENLNDSKDKNRAWENIKENIKTSAEDSLGLHELKQHKPWFGEEGLRFLDQMKQAKM